MITITDDESNLIVLVGTVKTYVPKSAATLKVEGNYVGLFNEDEPVFYELYSNVNTPSTSSAQELADAIDVMIENVASGGGGDASAANQVALSAQIGEVQASPTANTLLDRLKSIQGYLDSVEGLLASLGEVQASPTSNTVLDRLKTIQGYLDGVETLLSAATPAGENHLGSVGGKTGYAEITMTLDTSAYAAGDVLSNTVEITDILRSVGGSGIIHSIHVLDEDHQAQDIDVVFLRTNVSLGTRNAAVSISDANAREILGVVKIEAADYVDLVGSSSVTKTNLGIGCKGDALNDLFISMICRSGTPTHTASGITVKVVVLQD